VDGSRSLDREEFKAVLVVSAKDTYTPLSDADVLKVFEAVDTDNSGAYQLSLSGCYVLLSGVSQCLCPLHGHSPLFPPTFSPSLAY
jgi:hypothetical protein